jgi:very-short-patch-repair endonuclease
MHSARVELDEGKGLERQMSNEVTRARQMRKAQTKAESRAWWLLRSRNLAGFKFRRQHSIGAFFADFCCPELKLIIELEGSVHSQPSVVKTDGSRDEFLKREGYLVAHFPNGSVLKAPDEFIAQVRRLCEELQLRIVERA